MNPQLLMSLLQMLGNPNATRTPQGLSSQLGQLGQSDPGSNATQNQLQQMATKYGPYGQVMSRNPVLQNADPRTAATLSQLQQLATRRGPYGQVISQGPVLNNSDPQMGQPTTSDGDNIISAILRHLGGQQQ